MLFIKIVSVQYLKKINIKYLYKYKCLNIENTSRRNGKIGINVPVSLEMAISISIQWNRNG